MSDPLADFFSLLLLGGVLGTAVALVRPTSRSILAAGSSQLASILAVAATLASLYFSEIAGYVPCELCWYQRIAMYPLAVLLPMAFVRKDLSLRPYARLLAAVGLAIALYHVQLQMFPDQASFCALTQPCTESPVKALGVFTIPQMSAISFAGILLLTTISKPRGDVQ